MDLTVGATEEAGVGTAVLGAEVVDDDDTVVSDFPNERLLTCLLTISRSCCSSWISFLSSLSSLVRLLRSFSSSLKDAFALSRKPIEIVWMGRCIEHIIAPERDADKPSFIYLSKSKSGLKSRSHYSVQ